MVVELSDSSRRRALAAASVTVLLWASAFVSIRSAGAHFEPGALALGRMLTAALVLGAMLLLRRESLPPRAAWPGIAISGVLWFGAYMVLLNWGEQHLDAGTAAMVVNVGPLLIAVLSGWLLSEATSPRLWIGLAIAFAGAALAGWATSADARVSVLGVFLCLGAAACYAAGVVAQKPALRHAGPLQVTAWGCGIGAAACLPFAGQLVEGLAQAPVSAAANLLYLGLFPTALAFTCWAYALARTPAGKMGATTYVVPALVVLMSWAALGELPTAPAFAGGALCLLGVAVARSRPRRPETERRLARAAAGGGR